jgi:hypothetical protein
MPLSRAPTFIILFLYSSVIYYSTTQIITLVLLLSQFQSNRYEMLARFKLLARASQGSPTSTMPLVTVRDDSIPRLIQARGLSMPDQKEPTSNLSDLWQVNISTARPAS